jgi:zinc protease
MTRPMRFWLACLALAGFAWVGLAGVAAAAAGVERVVSPGGIEAWLIEDHSNPLIAVALGFHGGAALDPPGQEGLSYLAAGLMDEGAGDLDSAAFQQRLADRAIEFGFSASQDSIIGRVRLLTADRDEAFALLSEALTRPRFDAAPIARVRSQMLSIIAQRAGDPDSIADRAWSHLLLERHPYARSLLGNAQSLEAITGTDLQAFAAARFGRDQMRIAVVGDIDGATLSGLLDRSFAGLPAHAGPVALPEASPPRQGGVAVLERDLEQSVVVFGETGLKRRDPDYYAAALLDDIMGGGNFASRLQRSLREQRGLVYSIDTGLYTLDHAGLLSGSLGTKSATVGQAIDLVRAEWQRMRDDGPTAAELADAKTHLIGAYPLRFVDSLGSAESLLAIQLDGLPIDYIKGRKQDYGAVTLADARRVARRLYDPAALRFFVLGKPAGLAPTLKAPATD